METPSKVVSVDNIECLGPDFSGSQQAAFEYHYPNGTSVNIMNSNGGEKSLIDFVNFHIKTNPLVRTHEDGSMTVAACPRKIEDNQCFPFSLNFVRPEELKAVKERFADRCNRCMHGTQTSENTAK